MTGPWSGFCDHMPEPARYRLPRRMSAKRRRQLRDARAAKKRVARLKCVVFLTENPDVRRFFRIIPRGKRL